jgi:hypothetical protein
MSGSVGIQDMPDEILRCILLNTNERPDDDKPASRKRRSRGKTTRLGLLAEPVRATCKLFHRIVPLNDGRRSPTTRERLRIFAWNCWHAFLQFLHWVNALTRLLGFLPNMMEFTMHIWTSVYDFHDGWGLTFADAAGLGQTRLMEWAMLQRRWRFLKDTIVLHRGLKEAAKRGKNDAFVQILRGQDTIYWTTLINAAKRGHLGILKLAWHMRPNAISEENARVIMDVAIAEGRVNVMRWFVRNRNMKITKPIATVNLGVIHEALEHGFSIDPSSYKLGVSTKQPVQETLRALELLNSISPVQNSPSFSIALCEICMRRFVNESASAVLDWLRGKGMSVDPWMDYAVAIFGTGLNDSHRWPSVLDAVRWLAANGAGKTEAAFQHAVLSGMPAHGLIAMVDLGWPVPDELVVAVSTDTTTLQWIVGAGHKLHSRSLINALLKWQLLLGPEPADERTAARQRDKARARARKFADELLKLGCQWPTNFMWKCVDYGDLDTMQWARSRGCPWDAGVKQYAVRLRGDNVERHAMWRWLESRQCQRLYSEVRAWKPWYTSLFPSLLLAYVVITLAPIAATYFLSRMPQIFLTMPLSGIMEALTGTEWPALDALERAPWNALSQCLWWICLPLDWIMDMHTCQPFQHWFLAHSWWLEPCGGIVLLLWIPCQRFLMSHGVDLMATWTQLL